MKVRSVTSGIPEVAIRQIGIFVRDGELVEPINPTDSDSSLSKFTGNLDCHMRSSAFGFLVDLPAGFDDLARCWLQWRAVAEKHSDTSHPATGMAHSPMPFCHVRTVFFCSPPSNDGYLLSWFLRSEITAVDLEDTTGLARQCSPRSPEKVLLTHALHQRNHHYFHQQE